MVARLRSGGQSDAEAERGEAPKCHAVLLVLTAEYSRCRVSACAREVQHTSQNGHEAPLSLLNLPPAKMAEAWSSGQIGTPTAVGARESAVLWRLAFA